MKPFYKNERQYTPIQPCSDTDELAVQGDRLILRHEPSGDSPVFRVAPKGELTAGWVVGIFN